MGAPGVLPPCMCFHASWYLTHDIVTVFLSVFPVALLSTLEAENLACSCFRRQKINLGAISNLYSRVWPGLLVLSGFFLTPNSSMEKQTPLTQEATLRVAAPALPTLLRCNSPECTGPSSPALLCTQSEGWVEQRRCKVGQVPLGYFIPQCLLSIRMPQVCVDLPLLHASATLSTLHTLTRVVFTAT